MRSDDSVKQFFDSYSDRFDQVYRRDNSLNARFDRVLRRSIYERFDYVMGAAKEMGEVSVLDVGCGSGRYAVALARAGAHKVVGVDFAPSMVEMANTLARETDVADRVHIFAADFLQAPLDEKFDLSIAMGYFDYTMDPLAHLKRMAEHTTKRLIASFPSWSLFRSPQRRLRYRVLHHSPVYFYREADVRRLAETAGLRSFRIVRMKGGPGTDMLLDARLDG